MVVSVVPFKRKLSESEVLCVFCSEANDLVLNPKASTFLTVKLAAERRKDDVAKRFTTLYRPNEEDQTFSWHRTCLANYISEEKIRRREAALNKKFADDDENKGAENTTHPELRFPRRRINQDMYKNVCIICLQESKRKDKKLFLLCEKRAAENFLLAAKTKCDEVFTRICTCESVEELLAQELRYHRSCFNDYKYIRKSSLQKAGRPPDSIPHDVLISSFDKLIQELECGFENQAYELTHLTKRLTEIVGIEGVIVRNRTTKNLLVERFGEKVLFSHPTDRSKSSIVMMSSIPVEQMAEHLREVDNKERHLKCAALSLKEEMSKHQFPCEKFVKDDNVLEQSLNNFEIPPIWSSFLTYLLSTVKKGLSNNKLRRAKSIFMDLFFILTGTNTPKHIALAESIHHLTRSKHIISILFKLGHSVSYSDLQNNERQLRHKILLENQSGNIPLPANIVRNDSLFLHGAIDNNDFSEETLSGKDTTHVTAMVLYQEVCDVTFKRDLEKAVKIEEIVNASFSHTEALPCQQIKEFKNHSKTPICSSSVQLPPAQSSSLCRDSEILRILLKTRINHDIGVTKIENSGVPGWSPFQQMLTTNSIPTTTVGYCPIIPHAPTSKDVVYTAMVNFMNVSSECGKNYGVMTADMSIYLIAKRIQMQTSEFNNLVLRIGTFHLHKVWLRCLGQFLEDSGIETVVVDAGVYGENTFTYILNGLHYNRGVRAHKLIYEALRFILLSEFFKSSEVQDWGTIFPTEKLDALREAIAAHDDETFCESYRKLFCELQDAGFFIKFDEFMKSKETSEETVSFYMKYCEMVEILLDSIKADREANFDLHLSSVRRMLPFFFSMNHHIYARGVILYLNDMLQLPDEVENDLRRGMMSVKRTEGRFNAVGCDLALEQSQIRSSAVSGGLIGITKRQEAMDKWILLHPVKNSIHNVFTRFCDINNDPTGDVADMFSHSEWSRSRISRDEADCRNITEHLIDKNIFSEKDEILPLHNICNGRVVDESVSVNMLTLKEQGEEMLAAMVETCFEKKEKSVFDKMKRANFRNFSYVKKTNNNCNARSSAETELMKSKEALNFHKTIVLAVQREYDMKVLSSHELLDYPRALVDKDRLMKKPAKHTLVKAIENENNCEGDFRTILSSPTELIHIFDGMSAVYIVQPSKYNTFGEFAKAFYNYVTAFYENLHVERIDLVFDRYDDVSIKYMEAERRAKGSDSVELRVICPSTKMPKNIKNFLSSTKNKENLVRFLCQFACDYVRLKENQKLFISGGFQELCFKVGEEKSEEVCELRSNHLEADTRMFVHAFNAAKPGAQIVIHSSDTDVFILGIHFWQKLEIINCAGLWMKIQSKKPRILGCHLAAKSLGVNITEILPALHAYTGCDTTSKISTKPCALKLAKQSEVQHSLKPLGNGEDLTKDQYNDLEKLYLKLVNKPGSTVNETRFNMISSSSGINVNLDQLPCTSDALHQHALRASAQTFIWLNGFKPLYEPVDFNRFGYKQVNGNLVPIFQTKSAIPTDLIAPCKCKQGCKSSKCTCKKHGLICIKMCNCDQSKCKNV